MGEPGRPGQTRLNIQMTDPYRDWAERFAHAEGRSIADLVEDALRAHAEARGYEGPPDRRPVGGPRRWGGPRRGRLWAAYWRGGEGGRR